MKLKLYHAKWSLCSQMVRVALHEKGLSYESKLIKLCDQYPDAENLSSEYLNINPKGIVPSLVIDGEIVTESTNIIKKLNLLYGKNDIDLWLMHFCDYSWFYYEVEYFVSRNMFIVNL